MYENIMMERFKELAVITRNLSVLYALLNAVEIAARIVVLCGDSYSARDIGDGIDRI